MQLSYAKAEISALDEISQIYETAQEFMEENGNPQWKRGFPDENDIRGGILGGILYAVRLDGQIAGVFSAVNHESNYDKINGRWLTEGNYLAVHRVAVAERFRGRGVAKYILNTAATEIAHARGRGSIRMDTHEKNAPMRALLLSQGFTACGTVTIFRDDTERIAFERKIDTDGAAWLG